MVHRPLQLVRHEHPRGAALRRERPHQHRPGRHLQQEVVCGVVSQEDNLEIPLWRSPGHEAPREPPSRRRCENGRCQGERDLAVYTLHPAGVQKWDAPASEQLDSRIWRGRRRQRFGRRGPGQGLEQGAFSADWSQMQGQISFAIWGAGWAGFCDVNSPCRPASLDTSSLSPQCPGLASVTTNSAAISLCAPASL